MRGDNMEIYNGEYSIYCHTNLVNGKKYIGLTKKSPEERWGNGRNYKTCVCFNRAINKYGWNNFNHEIIASNLTKQEAENFERLLIEQLQTQNSKFGYNIRTGGDNHGDFTMGKNPRAKVVICDRKEFACISECANYYGVVESTMRAWLNGNNNMPQEWIDKGLNYKESPRNHTPSKSNKHYGRNNSKSKPVICKEKIYECIKYCAIDYGVKPSTMQSWLRFNRIPQKFQEYGLKYYNDHSKNSVK